MKLTRRKLEEIIKKCLLREYPEYFGKEFIAFKSRYERGEDPLSIAQSMLKEVGSGSTRRVFEFSDNPTVVLKVINTSVPMKTGIEDIHGFTRQHKMQSNEWEADLTMQQLYPDVFPRTFEVANNYSWILSERVVPLKSFEELLQNIGLGDENFPQGQMGRIQFQAVVEMAVEALKPGDSFAKQLVSEVMLIEADIIDNDPTMPMARRDQPKPGRQPAINIFKKRVMKILSKPHVRKIFKAMGSLNVPAREFSAKNLGISTISNKLMLLDASLWEEHKKLV